MSSIGRVHRSVRYQCTQTLAKFHWSGTLRDAEHADAAARYGFVHALLHSVEHFEESDFGGIENELESIRMCIVVATEDARKQFQPSWTRAHKDAYEAGLAAESAAMSASIEARDAPDVAIPFRRIMSSSEYTRTWNALCSRWGGDVSAGPGGGTKTLELVRANVRRALEAQSIDRVAMLHPMGSELSMFAAVALIGVRPQDGAPSWFPPMPVYMTSRELDWFVYFDDSCGEDVVAGWIEEVLTPRR